MRKKFFGLSLRKKLGFFISLAFIGVIALSVIAYTYKDSFKADTEPEDIINNQVSVSYKDSSGNPVTVYSDTTQTTVASFKDFTFPHGGWYLFSLPKRPQSSDITTIFKGFDFLTTGSAQIYRWDTYNQGLVKYDEWSPESFGPLDTGVGMWVQLAPEDVGKSISYIGYKEATPKTISLALGPSFEKAGGWGIIGNPFDHEVSIENNVFFSNGNETKNYCDATDSGWIAADMYGWTNEREDGGLFTAGCERNYSSEFNLKPNHGYWIQILRSDLQMIINP